MKPLKERRLMVEASIEISQEKQCDLLGIHRSGWSVLQACIGISRAFADYAKIR